MKRLLDLLFGCAHQQTTFPLTPKNQTTYIVCLDCGREFPYDWHAMRVSNESGRRPDNSGRELASAEASAR